jgi:hypothetical protein
LKIKEHKIQNRATGLATSSRARVRD